MILKFDGDVQTWEPLRAMAEFAVGCLVEIFSKTEFECPVKEHESNCMIWMRKTEMGKTIPVSRVLLQEFVDNQAGSYMEFFIFVKKTQELE
jgi:hypothetical protein